MIKIELLSETNFCLESLDSYNRKFYNSHHPDPNDPDAEMGEPDNQIPEGMFKFEKRMK